MKELISLKDLSHEDWLKARSTGIGSSDAAAILGASPWKSALELWAEKSGLLEAENLDEVEYVKWGSLLEAPIAEEYQKITGRKIAKPEAIYQHEKYDWMIANPDRFILDDPRGDGILEVKTASEYKVHDWDEEAPLDYQIQLQHQLAVSGYSFGSFAVLLGGNKFRWCDMARNDSFISLLIEQEGYFWDRVKRGDPPAPDASDSARETILRLHPKDSGAKVFLPAQSYHWSRALREAKACKKAAVEQIQEYGNLIEAAIGDATIGMLPPISPELLSTMPDYEQKAYLEHPKEIFGFNWKHQHRTGYVVQETDFRVLREEKAKKGKK